MSLSRHGGLGSLGDPLGLSGGLSSGLAASAPAANPNLLLWTEDLTKSAVWTLTNGDIVSTDQDGTADEWASSAANGSIVQITSTAATSGSAVTVVKPITLTLSFYSITGTFDGLPYTFTAKLKDTGAAAIPAWTMRLDRSGGFLRVSLIDVPGDADSIIGYLQLEQAATFTSYHSRGGT